MTHDEIRDAFAAAALTAILMEPDQWTPAGAAETAYEHANAMMAERAKHATMPAGEIEALRNLAAIADDLTDIPHGTKAWGKRYVDLISAVNELNAKES